MKDVKYILGAIAVAILLIQVWFRFKGSSITQWVWMFMVGNLMLSVWLFTWRRRARRCRHTRKLAAILFLVSVFGSTVILCTVPTDVPVP